MNFFREKKGFIRKLIIIIFLTVIIILLVLGRFRTMRIRILGYETAQLLGNLKG